LKIESFETINQSTIKSLANVQQLFLFKQDVQPEAEETEWFSETTDCSSFEVHFGVFIQFFLELHFRFIFSFV